MSVELKGKYGRIVGSEAYFKDLHAEHFVGALMQDSKRCSYYEMFRIVSEKIHQAFDEIYGDLKSNCAIIRYIPQKDRDSLDRVIMGLDAVCEVTGNYSRIAGECLAALALQSRLTKKHSNAKHSEVERAAKLVTQGPSLNKNERIRVIQQAVEHGTRRAVGNDRVKKQFLEMVQGDKKDDFLKDVWAKLDYDMNPQRFKGKCGQVLCGKKYIDHIERHVFGFDMPTMHGASTYKTYLLDKLEKIAEVIRRDLKTGEMDGDYITDENAARLKIAIAKLERCGVKYGGSKERIDRLAWFVGGDPKQIRELQKMLNELGIEGERGRLKVDGVYGRETHTGWSKFLDRFETGVVPSLTWIDPLQSKSTRIVVKSIGPKGKEISSLLDLSARNTTGKGTNVFRVDVPDTPHPFYHINTIGGFEIKKGKYLLSDRQKAANNKLNHFEISEDAYNVLKDFDNISEPVRVAGKVLLAAGLVLDTLELGLAVTEDLKDADKKLGTTTASAIASIGGRWIGGIAGAKAGAMAGATIGTAILPGVGTAIGGFTGGLILGIVGANTGDAFTSWIVDISCLED